jgi:DNA-binding NtrC family response regulator
LSSTSEETLDPTELPPPARVDARAVIEILFHPDLRRVGAHAPVDEQRAGDEPLVIGRDWPLFAGPGGLAPLADPCISRRQLALRWEAPSRLFSLAYEQGRRPIRLFRPDGTPLDGLAPAVAPGTLLALGDRILLRLAFRSASEGREMGLAGHSQAIVALRQQVAALADREDSVLILGETGTGKELVARALHEQGRRHAAPFLVINCAALPEALVESELFGHTRGAFSGATASRDGLFVAAKGGTVFLDEIGEMPLAVQAKLLRALQERAVRPVGGASEIPFSARVVAATHRDLLADVRAGRFRQDLFARLEAPRITLPPLRERREDIPLLLSLFLRRHAARGPLGGLFQPASQHAPALPLDTMLGLLLYPWPRNVRELEKFVATTAALQPPDGPFVVPPLPLVAEPAEPVPAAPASSPAGPRPDPRTPPGRDELLHLLGQREYNHNKVAADLSISHTTLHRWLRALGILRACDLPEEPIRRAHEACAGDLRQMARELGVSPRGLRLRLRELGLGGG